MNTMIYRGVKHHGIRSVSSRTALNLIYRGVRYTLGVETHRDGDLDVQAIAV